MRHLSTIATVAFIVALPVLLVTSNIRYLLGDVAFYERGLRKYDAVETTGLAIEDLDRAAAEIIAYFEDDSTTLRVIVTENGEETSLFNTRETTHMEDVKRLVRFVFRVNEVSLAFVVIYIAAVVLWSRERTMRRLALETLSSMGFAMVVLFGVGIFFVIGFDAAWDKFHEIVFPNDLWRLNPNTDRMIQMFPEKFWAEATLWAGALALAELLLLVAVAGVYLLFTRPPRVVVAEAPVDAPDMTQALPPMEADAAVRIGDASDAPLSDPEDAAEPQVVVEPQTVVDAVIENEPGVAESGGQEEEPNAAQSEEEERDEA